MALSASWQMASAERGARLKAFAAARRHSRRVRILRVALPFLAIGSVAVFLAVAKLAFPGGLDLEAARLTVTRNSIIMDRPHLTGFDRHHREYSMIASRAIQPFSNPRQVRLEDIEAQLESAAGGMTAITAESGDYDQANSTLQLYGSIVADTPDGFNIRLTDADIDLKAGTVSSANPVTITKGESHVSSNRISVTDGGKVIVFEGDVRTTVMPPKKDEAAVEASPAATSAQAE